MRVKPVVYVHPKALASLSENRIQYTGSSKRAGEFQGVDFNLVVTVCESAAEEFPIWIGKRKRVNRTFSILW